MSPATIPHRPQDDDLLYFVHIGKTGGTTLLSLLDAIFDPGDICTLRHAHEITALPQEEIQQYKLMRAHGMYSRVVDLLAKPPKLITLLRNPVDRTLSLYNHIVRDTEHELHEIVSQSSIVDIAKSDHRKIRNQF